MDAIAEKRRFKEAMIGMGVAFMILVFFSSRAWAIRPLSTDDAGTVEKGKFQIETGFDISREDNHDREIAPLITFSYGLLDNIDVGVGISYIFYRPKKGDNEDGLDDTELKLKYRILDEKEGLPAFALSATMKFPTASEKKGLGSGKADLGFNTILTKNLSKRWVVHVNLGYTLMGEHGADNEFNYSAAVQFVLSDRWCLVGEIGGVNNFNGHKRDDPFSGLLGAYYLFRNDIVWDVGVEIGMNRAAPDFRLTTGFTLLFTP